MPEFLNTCFQPVLGAQFALHSGSFFRLDEMGEGQTWVTANINSAVNIRLRTCARKIQICDMVLDSVECDMVLDSVVINYE